MTPAWLKRSDTAPWVPGWLVDGSPSGAGEAHVLVAYDDRPRSWSSAPPGSLRLTRLELDCVRLRRTTIPLHEVNSGDQ